MSCIKVPALYGMTKLLADVASGRTPPDLVIRGASLLSAYTETMRKNAEIWIVQGRIAAVKDAGACPKNSRTRFYEAQGGILAPGLVDPHLHIESSMMTACAYAEPALLNGTTTIFCDSHEIGNVCDVAGVEWMLEDARESALNIFLTIPSTVPATNATLETAGGDLTPEKIAGLFDKWPEAVGLGEKMDFVSVVLGDERSHAIISEALKRGRPVSGHVYGRQHVPAYVASGITDTHEAIDKLIAFDLLEAGAWIFLRGGNPVTPWHSLPEAIKACTELGASTKRVCLCTDDRDADDLFLFGMDWVARQAMKAGIAPIIAWSMGSLHAATRFHLDGEFGALGNGRRADIVLLNDSYEVQNTWLGGELVVEKKAVAEALEKILEMPYRYPQEAYHTVNIAPGLKLAPALPKEPCHVNVIALEPPSIVTKQERLDFRGIDEKQFMQEHQLCYLAVIERHGKLAPPAYGLLKGFGLKNGAVASSVGHDAHNIVVAGTSETDMQAAVQEIQRTQGGVCVVREGIVIAKVDLPVAGLISDKRAPIVAEETAELKAAWQEAGCLLPYMGFNLLPLSVIPDFRLTDKGLVSVSEMKLVPLFE